MAKQNTGFKKIERYFSPGEIIFAEGSEADGMYIVNYGKVSVFKRVRDSGGTHEIELACVGPSGMFGEMAVIDRQHRSASVRALESTKVTVITREGFEQQLSTLPGWVRTLIKLLVNRIRVTNDKLRKSLDENRANPQAATARIAGIAGLSEALPVAENVKDEDEDESVLGKEDSPGEADPGLEAEDEVDEDLDEDGGSDDNESAGPDDSPASSPKSGSKGETDSLMSELNF